MAVQIHAVFSEVLDGAKWLASCFDRFTRLQITNVTHWLVGWVVSVGCFNSVGAEKNLCPSGDLIATKPFIHLIA
jgi:hypothetical protein